MVDSIARQKVICQVTAKWHMLPDAHYRATPCTNYQSAHFWRNLATLDTARQQARKRRCTPTLWLSYFLYWSDSSVFKFSWWSCCLSLVWKMTWFALLNFSSHGRCERLSHLFEKSFLSLFTSKASRCAALPRYVTNFKKWSSRPNPAIVPSSPFLPRPISINEDGWNSVPFSNSLLCNYLLLQLLN